MNNAKKLHIALCVGEKSGDLIGAPLLAELQQRFPNARFSGVGGKEMAALGFNSLVPLEKLAVMGLVEVLGRLPELWRLRRRLLNYWGDNPPDLFVGIDAPDFNLPIARQLKQRGVKTVHYVSPSLWAWKSWRIHGIKKSVDLMLCLFPFETEIYRHHQLPAICVGHPMRDRLQPIDMDKARQLLHLPLGAKILGIFPGSRASERQRLAPIFIATAQRLEKENYLILSQPGADLPEEFLVKDAASELLMAACDLLLLKSGTITLEAALLQRPMVVAYRVHGLTALIARILLKIKRFALPNILLGRELVPELMQENCTVDQLERALLQVNPAEQLAGFRELGALLPPQASAKAAAAIGDLLC